MQTKFFSKSFIAIFSFAIVFMSSFATSESSKATNLLMPASTIAVVHGHGGINGIKNCPRLTRFHNCNSQGDRLGHCKRRGRWFHVRRSC